MCHGRPCATATGPRRELAARISSRDSELGSPEPQPPPPPTAPHSESNLGRQNRRCCGQGPGRRDPITVPSARLVAT